MEQTQTEHKKVYGYNKLYLTKYKKRLEKAGITIPIKDFLDQAFSMYLDKQLKLAETKEEIGTELDINKI